MPTSSQGAVQAGPKPSRLNSAGKTFCGSGPVENIRFEKRPRKLAFDILHQRSVLWPQLRHRPLCHPIKIQMEVAFGSQNFLNCYSPHKTQFEFHVSFAFGATVF